MSLEDGRITVIYQGTIPGDLKDYFAATSGARVTQCRPLVIETGRPDVVVNEIMRYLDGDEMATVRIQVRPARESAPSPAGRIRLNEAVPAAPLCA